MAKWEMKVQTSPAVSRIPWPFPLHRGQLWRMKSRFVVFSVATWSKIVVGWLNSVHVHNKQLLVDSVFHRRRGVPLVTVSNHHSCVDDPAMWGMFSWRQLATTSKNRWTPTAEEVCFYKPILSQFFALGQCVPIVRGAGVYQRAMDFCLELLDNGHWVHTFPEGRINVTKEFIRLKWGVGRLVGECQKPPIVLPLWHCGMDDVLPNERPYVPRFGQKVTVVVGDPVDCRRFRESNTDEVTRRKAITDEIQDSLQRLRKEAERLHYR